MRSSAEQAVMSCAIAQGRVWHQRLQPFTHRFDYPLWMVWCDLEKIDELLGRHWAWGRAWALGWGGPGPGWAHDSWRFR